MRPRRPSSRELLFLGAVLCWLIVAAVVFEWFPGEEEVKEEVSFSPTQVVKTNSESLPEDEPNQASFAEDEGADDQADQEETKKVAARFIQAYLSFDSKDPKKKIEAMQADLSKGMRKDWETPDHPDGVKKAKVTKVEMEEGEESLLDQEIGRRVWNVKVETETTFDRREKEKTWTLYEVVLGKEEGRWVVEEVSPIGDGGAEPLQLGGEGVEE